MLPDSWKDWLHKLYKLEDLTYENTLFVHLLVSDPRYQFHYLGCVLKSLFLNEFRLKYIVIVAPPNIELGLLLKLSSSTPNIYK